MSTMTGDILMAMSLQDAQLLKTIEDVVRDSLTPVTSLVETWDIPEDEPAIVQIYGTYLPAFYLVYIKDFMNVTSFHANPHAHHDTNGYIRSKLLSLKIPKSLVQKVITKIGDSNMFKLSRGVIIREEPHGAIIYTPQHNILFLNRRAYNILKRLLNGVNVASLSAQELKILIKLVMSGVIVPA